MVDYLIEFVVFTIAVGGLAWWFKQKLVAQKMLLMTTRQELLAAETQARIHENAAQAALDATRTALDTATTALKSAQEETRRNQSKFDTLRAYFGLPDQPDFTEEQITKASRREHLTKQLGADIHWMFDQARRKGIIG